MQPRQNFASTMVVEDHLKKCLAKTSGKPFKASNNKLLPKAQHSPFGDFPGDYMPKKKMGVTDMGPTVAMEQSIAATGTAILKKGGGLGGKTTSLLAPKEKPQPQKPKAGAF